jgi:hypothetical protein
MLRNLADLKLISLKKKEDHLQSVIKKKGLNKSSFPGRNYKRG